MLPKGPVRQEYIDAHKDGRFEEIPEHLRAVVADVVSRSTEKEITKDEHADLPSEDAPAGETPEAA